jgi:hypothetical protein
VDLFVGPARGLRWRTFKEHPGIVLSIVDGVRPRGHSARTRSSSHAQGHRTAPGIACPPRRLDGLRMRGQLRRVVDLARLMKLT